MTQLVRKYCGLLFTKHLLFTNVSISLSLSAAGDLLQQNYEMLKNHEKKWDMVRTGNMAVGGLTVGVFCHYSYNYLDMYFPGRTLRTVVKKVLVDQLVSSPLCITVFFITLGFMENNNVKGIVTELKQKWWRLYVADWVVWPPAQFVNFYILPTKYRVLYDNVISLGYDVYTSYVKNEVPLD